MQPTTTPRTIEEFLAQVEETTGRPPRPTWDGWQLNCPAHDDSQANLTVRRGEAGQILVKCHAGCEVDAVVAAIGWTLADLLPGELELVGATAGLPSSAVAGEDLADRNGDGLPAEKDNEVTAADGTANELAVAPQAVTPIAKRLSEFEPTAVEWLWPGRVPTGKLTLLVGDPGLGKSFLTLDLAARITRGWPLPTLDGEAVDDSMATSSGASSSRGETPVQETGSVVLLSAEDDASDTICPRFLAAGGDPTRMMILRAVGVRDAATGESREAAFSLASDLDALEQVIRSLGECRLVIIDPITAYLGKIDAHNNADVRSLLAPLSALAARTGVAILAINHLNKSNSSPALHRSLGSIAFAATARSALAVFADPYDHAARLLISLKSNLAIDCGGMRYRVANRGAAQLPVLKWERQPVRLTADEVLWAAGQNAASGGATLEAADWLNEMLRSGPQSAAQLKSLAKADGIHERTLMRAKSRLGLVTRRRGQGAAGIWTWQWPSDRPLPMEKDAAADRGAAGVAQTTTAPYLP